MRWGKRDQTTFRRVCRLVCIKAFMIGWISEGDVLYNIVHAGIDGMIGPRLAFRSCCRGGFWDPTVSKCLKFQNPSK